MSIMRYRADIDGLRAIAVLSVVLFHFGISRFFPGGFVGVDIFFVISGYLITGIVNREIDAGNYSTIGFYARRIRRIFPALMVVMLVCIAWGFLRLFPGELANQNRSIVASLLFVSNILFYRTADYFDPVIQYDLMLHTWSLSVEEQFYIAFPLLMVLLARFSDRLRKVTLAVLTAASFVACVAMTPRDPAAAFYLVPFRAWELLLGSLLGLNTVPHVRARWAVEAIGVAGIVAIGVAVGGIQGEAGFPGYLAALPALGAVALLYAGGYTQPSWINRALAIAPLRFIGLISYSLYLWHWPLLIFVTSEMQLRGAAKIVLLGVAIVIAILSWHVVERPFRRGGQTRDDRVGVVGTGIVAMMVVAFVALVTPLASRATWPMPAAAERALAFQYRSVDGYMRKGSCFLSTGSNALRFYQADRCLGMSPKAPNILILGDSHAAHLWSGYHAAYPAANVLQATASGCKPLLRPSGQAACVDLIEQVSDVWLPAHRVNTIVLAARWDAGDVPAAVAMASFLRRHADKVILVGPVPTYRQTVPRLVAAALAKGIDPDRYADGYRLPEPAKTDALFRQQALTPGVFYASPLSLLCRPLCRTTGTDGMPLQFDYGHLTESGSRDLAKLVRP